MFLGATTEGVRRIRRLNIMQTCYFWRIVYEFATRCILLIRKLIFFEVDIKKSDSKNDDLASVSNNLPTCITASVAFSTRMFMSQRHWIKKIKSLLIMLLWRSRKNHWNEQWCIFYIYFSINFLIFLALLFERWKVFKVCILELQLDVIKFVMSVLL